MVLLNVLLMSFWITHDLFFWNEKEWNSGSRATYGISPCIPLLLHYDSNLCLDTFETNTPVKQLLVFLQVVTFFDSLSAGFLFKTNTWGAFLWGDLDQDHWDHGTSNDEYLSNESFPRVNSLVILMYYDLSGLVPIVSS